MAAWQVGETLKPGDNRCAVSGMSMHHYLKTLFCQCFTTDIKTDFHLDVRRNNSRNSVRGFEGAFKGLRSQEQEQEQRKNRNRTKTLWFMAKKTPRTRQGMFRPSILVASRHDTGSRFSVCAESRFGRCAAGDDRKAEAITPTAAA